MKQTNALLALILFTGVFLCSASCSTLNKEKENEEQCETVKPDSLVNLWINAWNTKDSAALTRMIDDQAVLINDGIKFISKDSIMANWVRPGLPVVNNMNCDIAGSSTCCCCLSASGFYKIDVGDKENMKKATGSFTFIWKKQDDKSWKMELIHIATLPE